MTTDFEGPPTLASLERKWAAYIWDGRYRDANALAEHVRDAMANNPYPFATYAREDRDRSYNYWRGLWVATLTFVNKLDFDAESRRRRHRNRIARKAP